MMASFDTMGRWLEDKVGERLVKMSKNLSNHAYSFVSMAIKLTPVDTSTALSNWRVSVGYGLSGEIEAYSLGSKGSTASVSKGTAMATADAKLASRRQGEAIYIINHVQYIGDLNKGTSPQAGAGYVSDLIAKLGNDIKVGL